MKAKHLIAAGVVSLGLFLAGTSITYHPQNVKNYNVEIPGKFKRELDKSEGHNLHDIVRDAGKFTNKHLRFSFKSLISDKNLKYLVMDTKKVKSTNCVDYAYLFDESVSYLARNAGISVRSDVVQGQYRIAGILIIRHNVNKITTAEGKVKYYDPTINDYLGILNITSLVK